MTIGDTGRRLDVDVLLASVIKQPREFLYAHPEYTLTTRQAKKLLNYLHRREQNEPVAYITGHKEFYGLNFIVNRDVLIPRPDTELLVDTVVQYCGNVNQPIHTIADIGTGSGNIAIVLKKLLPTTRVLATDISPAALRVLRRNARTHQVTIPSYCGNALAALPQYFKHQLDMIVSNPPYLTGTEANHRQLQFEPRLALTAGRNSTKIIERILQQAHYYLKPSGSIIFEIGYRQAMRVNRLCRHYFPKASVVVSKDLAGLDRVIVCRTSS
ncbi:MAG: peptide chain release factor N(5)-glutamine methyltransferase [Candidatus Kerfeldbacteria bacterium]|nr:peptide chain release factor N(5)-glutamine methyltransferase [Candidatus Kerfeldbacteria bacterium]